MNPMEINSRVTDFHDPGSKKRTTALENIPCFKCLLLRSSPKRVDVLDPPPSAAGSLELSQKDCFYEQTSVSSSYLTVLAVSCSLPQKCPMVLVGRVCSAVLSRFLD